MGDKWAESSLDCKVAVRGPTEPIDLGGDVSDDDGPEGETVSLYVHGPLGQTHVFFPVAYRWMWRHGGTLSLVAVAVRSDAQNGPAAFSALYTRDGDVHYRLTRYTDDQTNGDTYDGDLDDFVSEHGENVLWVDDDFASIDDLLDDPEVDDGS